MRLPDQGCPPLRDHRLLAPDHFCPPSVLTDRLLDGWRVPIINFFFLRRALRFLDMIVFALHTLQKKSACAQIATWCFASLGLSWHGPASPPRRNTVYVHVSSNPPLHFSVSSPSLLLPFSAPLLLRSSACAFSPSLGRFALSCSPPLQRARLRSVSFCEHDFLRLKFLDAPNSVFLITVGLKGNRIHVNHRPGGLDQRADLRAHLSTRDMVLIFPETKIRSFPSTTAPTMARCAFDHSKNQPPETREDHLVRPHHWFFPML